MRRIYSTVAAIFLASSVASAGGFEGGEFYLGATGGVSSPNIESTVDDPAGFGDKMSLDVGKAGVSYGIHAGWRFPVSKGFHGVEISVKDSTAEGDFDLGGQGGGFEINESYDLSYKGGYEFAANTFLTGRLGVGQLRASHSISDGWDIGAGTFEDTLNYVVAGLGIEHRMDAKYSITAEYLYRGAEDMKKRHMYTDNSGNWTDIKGEYSDHSFMIGINYFF